MPAPRRTELPLRELCPEIAEMLSEMRAAYDVECMLRHEPLMWPSASFDKARDADRILSMTGTKTGRISSAQPNLSGHANSGYGSAASNNYPRPFDYYSQLELELSRLHCDQVDALGFAFYMAQNAKP